MYKNYEGELVTLYIEGKEERIARSLTELNVEVDDNGIMVLNKVDNSQIGYLTNVCGIELIDFMKFFGYELLEDNCINNEEGDA